MSSAVAMTNKSIAINVYFPLKSKKIPKVIKKSQQALAMLNRWLLNYIGSHESYIDLKNQYVELKRNHRKLERFQIKSILTVM